MKLQDYAMPLLNGTKLYALYHTLKKQGAFISDNISNTFIQKRLEKLKKT